jgi:hypothetical protein
MERRAWGRWTGPVVACLVLGVGYLVQNARNRRLSRSDPPSAFAAPPPAAAAPALPTAPPAADAGRKVVRARPPARTEQTEDPAPSGNGLPFALTEASQRTGVVNTHQLFVPAPSLAHIAPWMNHIGMGAGAAVADFDGDGWPDIYLTNSAVGSRNRLFRNNHDGTFTDVAERAGVADVNRKAGSIRALFFDYDNDGHKDLLITTTYCPMLFHNNGDGTFTDVTAKSGLDYCGFTPAVNVVDYDNDGFLDIILGGYYKPVDLSRPDTLDFMPTNWFGSDNGGPIVVYHNNGNGTFTRVPGNLGITSRGWNLAIGVYDLRGTGRPDLYFATDYGLDQVYFNDGNGHFSDHTRELRGTFSRHGMSADAADVDNDGQAEIFVTHIYHPGKVVDQNVVWKVDAAGHFRNVSTERGIDRCGWSWAGKFVDLKNDGWLDIVVSNGFLSADPNTDFWDFAQAYDRASNGMLLDRVGAMFADASHWPNIGKASMAGYEKKCVYYNRAGRFEEVVDKTGMADDRSDGRALAVIDYRNDGSQSLVEANVGQPARFYANRQLNKNRWIGFELIGTRSNRDSFGAEATLVLEDGRTMTRQLEPANAHLSQSDPRLHFGLGPAPTIKSVRVRWPSGAELVIPGRELALDRYHALKEPLK